ncbi:MAG: hypothetical protein KDD67_03035 [Ignavibacteriae bacterium]|nr:hypothetical protein [Ignavibacteriota bacterium]MCB9217016.1 hypothetical protein [Ignavibacteria bacterium]
MLRSTTISRIIRIALVVLFILLLFRMGGLFSWAYLSPELVWPLKEFWRLLTYPLALSFGGLLIGSIVFSQPGEEIEEMFGKRAFGLALLIVTLLTAGLHLLCFWERGDILLQGPMNISLFVLVGFVYLFPASSVGIFFFRISSKIILWVSLGVVGVIGGLKIAAGTSPLILLSEGMSGALFGAIWFHIIYQKYPLLLGPIRSLARILPTRSEKKNVRPVVRGRTLRLARKEETPVKSEKQLSDEEKLNRILEKIGESGYESLNVEEQQFLDDYSSKL